MIRQLRLSRTLVQARTFATGPRLRADKANGGFGEEARQQQGKDPVKDTAPYQNEYTKSGTNTEVAHNDESYSSSNTNPEQSNRQQGEALDGSPANKAYSDSYDPNHSNKTHRSPSTASGYKTGKDEDGSSSGMGNRSGNNSASKEDVSQDKFEKLSKKKGDVQQVGGRRVTN